MVSYEKPYDGSPAPSDVGSLKEKVKEEARTHDDVEPTNEFDVYGDETHADSM